MQDPLLNGQTLVPGSLKVHKLNFSSSGSSVGTLVPAGDYSYAVDGSNVLRVNLGAINSGYYITFKTTLDGKLINNDITNIAKVLNGTTPVSENLEKTVTIPKAGEYVFKKRRKTDPRSIGRSILTMVNPMSKMRRSLTNLAATNCC